ncbi:MAG: SOS response-associated peptidase [Betaproteobacteria bacterium]
MCAHYETVHQPARLRQYFGVEPPTEALRRDIWPGYLSTFIVGDDKGWQARLGCFGLIPHWAKDAKIARHTYNARSETVADKPSFRDAWRKAQHCIVPMDSFFEPDWRSGKAVPTRISHPDGRPLGAAGLWSLWHDPQGQALHSFTLLTVNADDHPFMQQFHKADEEKRMIVVLAPEHYQAWLQADAVQAPAFLGPQPAGEFISIAPQTPAAEPSSQSLPRDLFSSP